MHHLGMRSGRFSIPLVAALALLSLGSALLQESFVHTDDGCEVETHCLACRLAVASAPDVPAPTLSAVPPDRLAGLLELCSQGGTLERSACETRPRAPPAA